MGKIAFVFPGQGSQYIGMGREIADNFKVAENIFERASSCLKCDMKKLCFEGPDQELKKTENTQPAILAASIAIFEVLKEHGLEPEIVAGLSLGEYTALVSADVINFEDAVKVVRARGKYMQEEIPLGLGAMAAINGLEKDKVIAACLGASEYGIAETANFNCPGQVVISGDMDAVEKAIEIAKKLGARSASLLNVSAPFHSSLLKGAGEKLKGELDKIEIKNFSYSVISNTTAEYYSSSSSVRDLLIKQVSSPILWEDTIRKMVSDGVNTFVEVGPGKSLSTFIKRTSRSVKVLNVEDMESFHKVLKELN